jgi:hypothetical protein
MAVVCVTVEKSLVSYSVYCSICKANIPIKWQNLKNSTSASNFSFNWWQNGRKTLNILEVAFGQQKMGRTHVFDWLSKLNRSVTSVEDVKNSEHPSKSTTECNMVKVQGLVLENKRIAIHKAANVLGI